MFSGTHGRKSAAGRAGWMLLAAAGVALCGEVAQAPTATSAEPATLKIGLLMDFSGGSEVSRDRRRAFELAVKHVNDGGGVLGSPVAVAVGDTTAEPAGAVAEARRLIEVEGVHAIVGPNSSANTLPIAEQVIGPAGIPTISFAASSPQLTVASDDDFLFRTALSDVAQGPVLARVARERGFENVGLLHVDDPWGRGLADAFAASWDGEVRILAVDRGRASYLAELRESASGGAQALVVIVPEGTAKVLVQEAIDAGLYDSFVFSDGVKRLSLVRSVGGARLGGMYGTGPASESGSAASAAWEESYVAEYGALPVRAYAKETYDATVALALAAQAAGGLDGHAIRDRLRAVGDPQGAPVRAGPRGVAEALRKLAMGGEVSYEGASGDIEWDENGDRRRGHIGIWRFTEDERIEEVGVVAFER